MYRNESKKEIEKNRKDAELISNGSVKNGPAIRTPQTAISKASRQTQMANIYNNSIDADENDLDFSTPMESSRHLRNKFQDLHSMWSSVKATTATNTGKSEKTRYMTPREDNNNVNHDDSRSFTPKFTPNRQLGNKFEELNSLWTEQKLKSEKKVSQQDENVFMENQEEYFACGASMSTLSSNESSFLDEMHFHEKKKRSEVIHVKRKEMLFQNRTRHLEESMSAAAILERRLAYDPGADKTFSTPNSRRSLRSRRSANQYKKSRNRRNYTRDRRMQYTYDKMKAAASLERRLSYTPPATFRRHKIHSTSRKTLHNDKNATKQAEKSIIAHSCKRGVSDLGNKCHSKQGNLSRFPYPASSLDPLREESYTSGSRCVGTTTRASNSKIQQQTRTHFERQSQQNRNLFNLPEKYQYNDNTKQAIMIQNVWRSHRSRILLTARLLRSWWFKCDFESEVTANRILLIKIGLQCLTKAISQADCLWKTEDLRIEENLAFVEWTREVDIQYTKDGTPQLRTCFVSLKCSVTLLSCIHQWSNQMLAISIVKATLEQVLRRDRDNLVNTSALFIQRWMQMVTAKSKYIRLQRTLNEIQPDRLLLDSMKSTASNSKIQQQTRTHFERQSQQNRNLFNLPEKHQYNDNTKQAIMIQNVWRSHRSRILLTARLLRSWWFKCDFESEVTANRILLIKIGLQCLTKAISQADCLWKTEDLRIEENLAFVEWTREVDIQYTKDGTPQLRTCFVSLKCSVTLLSCIHQWSNQMLAISIVKATLEQVLRRDRDNLVNTSALFIQRWMQMVTAKTKYMRSKPTPSEDELECQKHKSQPPLKKMSKNQTESKKTTGEIAYKQNTNSATILQAWARQWKESSRYMKIHRGLILLQAETRGKTQRRKLKVAIQSVIVMQAMWRQHTCRSFYVTLLANTVTVQSVFRMVRCQISMKEQQYNATAIQCTYRGRLARQQQREQIVAASTIQSVWRKYMIINLSASILQAWARQWKESSRYMKIHRGLILLQAETRGKTQRRKLKVAIQSVIVIQAMWRQHTCRSFYVTLLANTVTVQSIFRMVRCQISMKEQQHNATAIQCMYRGRLARQQQREQIVAASTIQSVWRKYMIKKLFEGRKQQISSAISIQSLWRKVRCKQIFQANLSAIIAVQALNRGRLARQDFASFRINAVLIQSVFRKAFVQQLISNQRDAALQIESAWYRHRDRQAHTCHNHTIEQHKDGRENAASVVLQMSVRSRLHYQKETDVFMDNHHSAKETTTIVSVDIGSTGGQWTFDDDDISIDCQLEEMDGSPIVNESITKDMHIKEDTQVGNIDVHDVGISFSNDEQHDTAWSFDEEDLVDCDVSEEESKFPLHAAQNKLANHDDNLDSQNECNSTQIQIQGTLAVLVLQAWARQWKESSRYMKIHRGLILLQAETRGKTQRRKLKVAIQSVIVMQAMWRQHTCRSFYVTLLANTVTVQSVFRMVRCQISMKEQQHNATAIQCMYRGRLARQQQREQIVAASTIQSVWRKYMIKKLFEGRKQQISSAISIQSLWRKVRCKQIFQANLSAIIAVQALNRGRLARQDFASFRINAVLIQSVFRKAFVQQLISNQRDAALQIESAWYRHRDRQAHTCHNHTIEQHKDGRENAASVVLQMSVRSRLHYQKETDVFMDNHHSAKETTTIVSVDIGSTGGQWTFDDDDISIDCQLEEMDGSPIVNESITKDMHIKEDTQVGNIDVHDVGISFSNDEQHDTAWSFDEEDLVDCDVSEEESKFPLHAAQNKLANHDDNLDSQNECNSTQIQIQGTLAVLVLQAWARQWKESSRYMKIHRGLILLQAETRGKTQRRKLKVAIQSVIVMQAMWRQHTCRSFYVTLLANTVTVQSVFRMVRCQISMKEQQHNATAIQCMYRGRLARQQQREQIVAASTIQSVWRKYMIKKLFEGRKQQISSAISIQSLWRKVRCKQIFQANLSAIIAVQALNRGRLARQDFASFRINAVLIQSVFRKAFVQQLISNQRDAALQIESAWYRHRDRQAHTCHNHTIEQHKDGRENAASVVLQMSVRSRLHYQKETDVFMDNHHSAKETTTIVSVDIGSTGGQWTFDDDDISIDCQLEEMDGSPIVNESITKDMHIKEDTQVGNIDVHDVGISFSNDEQHDTAWSFDEEDLVDCDVSEEESKFPLHAAQNKLANHDDNLDSQNECNSTQIQIQGTLAVLVLQAWARQWKESSRYMKIHRGLILLQAETRGKTQRRKLKVAIQSVIVMQAMWRQHTCRSFYVTLLANTVTVQSVFRMVRCQISMKEQQHNATAIQCMYRGRLARQQQREQIVAASTIQSVWRKYMIKKLFEGRKQQISSAISIQSLWRKVRCKQIFQANLSAIIAVQALNRGRLARQDFASFRINAVLIQSVFRKAFVQQLISNQRDAALQIESAWYRHRDRQAHTCHNHTIEQHKDGRENAASVVLQMSVRSRLHYQKETDVFMDNHHSAKETTTIVSVDIGSTGGQWTFDDDDISIDCQLEEMDGSPIVNESITKDMHIKEDTQVGNIDVHDVGISFSNDEQHDTAWSFDEEDLVDCDVSEEESKFPLHAAQNKLANHDDNLDSQNECNSTQIQIQGTLAVLVLQAWARQWKESSRYMKIHRGLILLQAETRGKTQRRKLKVAIQSVIVMQAMWRQHTCRSFYVTLLANTVTVQSVFRMVRCQISMKEQQHNATAIQCMYRGRLARQQQREQIVAASTIQSVWRKYMIKKLFEGRKQQISSAISIQSLWRKVRCKQIFQANLSAIIAVQALNRGRLARQDFASFRINAVLIQRLFRGARARRRFFLFGGKVYNNRIYLDINCEDYIEGIIRLQSLARMVSSRTKFLKMLSAARLIERVYFSWKRQDALLQLESSTILLNRSVRGHLPRAAMNFALVHLNVSLHSSLLAHSVDNSLEQDNLVLDNSGHDPIHDALFDAKTHALRSTCIFLQCEFRGILARKKFLKQKAASILIQRFWRRHEYPDLLDSTINNSSAAIEVSRKYQELRLEELYQILITIKPQILVAKEEEN